MTLSADSQAGKGCAACQTGEHDQDSDQTSKVKQEHFHVETVIIRGTNDRSRPVIVGVIQRQGKCELCTMMHRVHVLDSATREDEVICVYGSVHRRCGGRIHL